MIIVVTEAKKKASLPKWATHLWSMLSRSVGYAFENEKDVERFVKFQQANLSNQSKRRIQHSHNGNDGTIEVVQIRHNHIAVPFITLKYLVLHGHVHVTKDGMLITQNFFQENYLKDS